jgi:hypothetical protein
LEPQATLAMSEGDLHDDHSETITEFIGKLSNRPPAV